MGRRGVDRQGAGEREGEREFIRKGEGEDVPVREGRWVGRTVGEERDKRRWWGARAGGACGPCSGFKLKLA